MKWLKNMSTKELGDAYEKVTNEEGLHEFEKRCQEIGIQIHKVVKDVRDLPINGGDVDNITYHVMNDSTEVWEAVKGLVNHSLKMMDK